MQDSKGWVRGWLHGLPVNFFLLLTDCMPWHRLQATQLPAFFLSGLQVLVASDWVCVLVLLHLCLSSHSTMLWVAKSFPLHSFTPALCWQSCPILHRLA